MVSHLETVQDFLSLLQRLSVGKYKHWRNLKVDVNQ